MAIETIKWVKGAARIIDQTKLPHKLEYIHCCDVETMWQAIKRLSVRGAPALGVAAAFGVLLGIKEFRENRRRALGPESKQAGPKARDRQLFEEHFYKVCDYIGTSRPTAVNLFNALSDMKEVVRAHPESSVSQLKNLLKQKAFEIYNHDRRVCRQMGDYGVGLIKNHANVLTVCNAGALATVDYGTALGVVYSAKKKGKKFKVYSCETRPLLQGARLTVWELLREKIDTTLICDNMAATLMKQGKIDLVMAGADRIASNGDTANKIGTYNLAVLARYHKIPFYIAAPRSTFDFNISSGRKIPIEERNPDEVTGLNGRKTAPPNVKVYNPAFDVTDHRLITAIITEYGIICAPFKKNIKKIFKTNIARGAILG